MRLSKRNSKEGELGFGEKITVEYIYRILFLRTLLRNIHRVGTEEAGPVVSVFRDGVVKHNWDHSRTRSSPKVPQPMATIGRWD